VTDYVIARWPTVIDSVNMFLCKLNVGLSYGLGYGLGVGLVLH